MGEGGRAYAINGCKRAYSQVWRTPTREIHELQMVACWVLAGMRLLHPSVSEGSSGTLIEMVSRNRREVASVAQHKKSLDHRATGLVRIAANVEL